YMYQELAQSNIAEFQAAGVKKILTACPHCLKTLGPDYRLLGFEVEVVHASVLLSQITGDVRLPATEDVTLHDPCYLARYAGHVEEPRELLARVGANVKEPERNRKNPFCCGAGGGLLFEEREEGQRISQTRFEQLQATGAGTIITACPFCSIMLKGAQASSNATTQVVDIMTYVGGRLRAAKDGAQPPVSPALAPPGGASEGPAAPKPAGHTDAGEGPAAPKPAGHTDAGEGGRTS
ncbi:MAG: (Fe-S)-binding protein, partial [Acidobacteria bacterium]